MNRVKRGTTSVKRRKNVLKQTKGFRHGRSSKEAQATEAILHAGTYAFAHRKDKKSDARRLWQTRISAALKPHGFSYSKFIGALKKKEIELDRKILSDLAIKSPMTFEKIVKSV